MTAMKKLLIIPILLISLMSVFVPAIHAVDSELNDQVESEEETRKNEIRTLLGLDIPTETDNPNYQIEFEEPEDTDVEIKIDSGDYAVKKSPYTLPSLSIGKHTVTFKYEDEDELEQTLEETLIVLPRVPGFSESEDLSFNNGSSVTFSGTALPNSNLVFIISSDLVMQVSTSDSDGAWTLTVNETLAEGSHQIVGFVRKDGYASDFSDPVSFSVGSGQDTTLDVGESGSSFFDNINIDFSQIFSEQNKYYFIGAGGVLLIIVLAFLGGNIKTNRIKKEDAEKLMEKDIKGKDDNLTLREKLSGGKEKPSAPKPSTSAKRGKPSQGKKEKVIKSEERKVEKPIESTPKEPEKEIKEEIQKELEKNIKPVEPSAPKASTSQGNRKKRGIFSGLFGKKDKEAKESVKKVVSKDEFVEEFKDKKKGMPKAASVQGKKVKKVKVPAKGEAKPEKKEKPEEPSSTSAKRGKPGRGRKSKSNKIEVTLR